MGHGLLFHFTEFLLNHVSYESEEESAGSNGIAQIDSIYPSIYRLVAPAVIAWAARRT
jgi:hypothetical protein